MMEPDTTDNKNDEDSSTKYILEYYRKYSQDKKLPKYFSGTSIAYLPEIVDDDEKKSNTDININVEIPTEDQSTKAHEAEELELSPTGSIGSNKKLEWDNLADIGYDNAQTVHRSSSLPSFSQLSKKNNCASSELSKSGGSNVKVIIYPYLSSSEEKSADANAEYSSYSPIGNKDLTPTSSTSSSAAKESIIISDNTSSEDKVSSFKQTLDYLKTKIGVPDAHSTPCESKFQMESIEKMSGTKIHVPDAHSTPCESKFQLESFEKMSGTPFTTKHGKPVKQLINPSKNTKIAPKNAETQTNKILDIQDNYSTKLTSGKAGEQLPSNLKKKVVNLCLTKPVLLDCISEKVNTTRLTIGIQTEATSKVEDKLHQLIPVKKLSDGKKTRIEAAKSSSSNGLASNCDSFEYIKNTKEEPIIKVNEQSNKDQKQMYEKSESSQDVKIIETTSKKASNDIEHTIYVLQKLLRSKKYDSSTKKKYINKILQKLMESKNMEDSSTSSELFYPKTDSSRILKDQIKKSFKNEGSSSSYQSNENKKFSPSKRKPELTKTQKLCKETKIGLSKNLESKSSSLLLSPKRKNTKTDTLDNFASLLTEFVPKKGKEIRKGPFTLSTHCDNSSHEEKYFSSSTTKSYENWKELQTNSELTFASNGKSLVGDGDHLFINFADKERQFQLNWIDREINHLGKLKSLLEKPRTPFEEGRKITTTSVYVVSGGDNGKNNAPRRNYVIETELGVKGPQPRNFCLNGENYTVRDPKIQETGKHKKSQPAVANIEVHSDEKTTNIKVRTYCSVCKNAPCICRSILDNLQTLGNDEKPCSARASSKYSEKRTQRPDKNSCVVCGYVTCVCNNGNDKTESKSCSVCQSPTVCNCETQRSTLQNPCCSVPVKGYTASPNGKEEETEFCLCELGLSDDKSSSSNDNQSGSLGKIFKDCRCDADTECNCDFVSKLLKHFSTRQTDNSKPLQDCGIQVTPPTNICFKQADTFSKDQTEQKECSPDYLCSLISRIEAFFDKNGKKRACTRSTTDKGTTTSTTCSPPRVECVPDVPLCQCCPNKSSGIDKGTTCSPVKVLCDQCTSYSPPVEQCSTYKPSVNDDTITITCTPDTFLFNKETANQETCYEPPQDPCNCDEPSESKLPKDKNGKETLCLQVSKDVKSIDMSFCLCGSKKNSGKGDKNEDCCDKKKKPKKKCECKCNHCTSTKESSSNSTSKGDSNKPRACRCSSKSTKKDNICCCPPKTNENSNEDTTADTLSTNTTDATPILVCSLCNRTTSYAKLSMLRTNDEEYALCSECVGKRPILTTTCYAGPDLESDGRPLSGQSRTATDGFQLVNSYCTCPKGTSSKNNRFDYCPHCRNQLRRTLKSRNGIAYTLTLEDEPLERCRYRKSKKKSKLKEIKVKVPCPYHRKNVKNQENVHRKDENRIKELESGEVSEQNENCRCENDVDNSTTEMNENAANKSNKDYTLQEYLKKNRPDFIDSADYRRKTVLNNRVGREQIKDDLKLRFLKENDNNNLKRQKNKLFTEQEMRKITKRNYKKLPEIQNKATLLRLQKLRNADKYITDVFKKKIQNCILKGKSHFPIDSNIVNYYK